MSYQPDALEEAQLLRDPKESARPTFSGASASGVDERDKFEGGKVTAYTVTVMLWITLYHGAWLCASGWALYQGVHHWRDKSYNPSQPATLLTSKCTQPVELWLLVSASACVVNAVLWLAFSARTLERHQHKAGFWSLLQVQSPDERTAVYVLFGLFFVAWNLYGSVLYYARLKHGFNRGFGAANTFADATQHCPTDLDKTMWWFLLFSWVAFPGFVLVLLFLVYLFLRKKTFT